MNILTLVTSANPTLLSSPHKVEENKNEIEDEYDEEDGNEKFVA